MVGRVKSMRVIPIKLFAKQFSLLCVAAVIVLTGSASAITSDQQDVFSAGSNYYDIDVSSNTDCSGTVTALVGSDNVQKAFNYFVGKGLTPAQSAGIVGNLMQESGVNPNSVSNGGQTIGIAQWEGGRDDALRAFAQKAGKPYTDLGVQLDYLWQELTTGYQPALAAVKATSSAGDAAQAFELGFEHASNPVMENRIRNANDVLATYGKGATGVGKGTTTGCGGGGNFATNFIEYKQCGKDAPWANDKYDGGSGGGTVCSGGCGPSAMAMIVTNLTGKKVTPADTSAYGMANGTAMGGGGSLWNIADVIGSHWGLKATPPLGQDIAAINKVLQAGGLVLATGRGSVPFTGDGHFIVIRALTSDGKWLTGNSANIDSSKPYDPQTVISNGSSSPGFNAWGLTKQ